MESRSLGKILLSLAFCCGIVAGVSFCPAPPTRTPSPQSPNVFHIHVTRNSVTVRIDPAVDRNGVVGYKVFIGHDWSCDVNDPNVVSYCERENVAEGKRYMLLSQTKFNSGYGDVEIQGFAETVHLNMPGVMMTNVDSSSVHVLLTPAWNQTGIRRYRVTVCDTYYTRDPVENQHRIHATGLRPETWYALSSQYETSTGWSQHFLHGFVYTVPRKVPRVSGWQMRETWLTIEINAAPDTGGVREYGAGLGHIRRNCQTTALWVTQSCYYERLVSGGRYMMFGSVRTDAGWSEAYLTGYAFTKPTPPKIQASFVGSDLRATFTPTSKVLWLGGILAESRWVPNEQRYTVFNSTAGLVAVFRNTRAPDEPSVYYKAFSPSAVQEMYSELEIWSSW